MVIKISRRGAVRAVSLLCAAVLALCAISVVNARRAAALKRQSQTATQHALRELGEHLDNITTSLQKARYAGSGKLLSQLERELSRSAACCVSAPKTRPSPLPLRTRPPRLTPGSTPAPTRFPTRRRCCMTGRFPTRC